MRGKLYSEVMELRAVVKPRWTPEDYRTRPKEYDPSLADIIIERIGNGEYLPAICASDRELPLPGTFLRWCELDPLLDAEYVSARKRGTEVNVDEMAVASYLDNVKQANLISKTIQAHVQMTDPARYGPRATLKLPGNGDNEDGGIDYRSEVRRKVDALAARFGQDEAAATEAKDGG